MADEQDPPVQEADRQTRAFELYLSQGGRRSYLSVAQEIGVSLRTIKNWASKHNWPARIAEREATIARRVADQALNTGVDERLGNLRIVHMAIKKLARAILEDRVRFQAADLDRLLRLADYLAAGSSQGAWLNATPQQIVEAIRSLPFQDYNELRRLFAEHSRRPQGPAELPRPGED